MIDERINWLRDELERHNHRYYVEDNPTITDFEYDKLMKWLSLKVKIHY